MKSYQRRLKYKCANGTVGWSRVGNLHPTIEQAFNELTAAVSVVSIDEVCAKRPWYIENSDIVDDNDVIVWHGSDVLRSWRETNEARTRPDDRADAARREVEHWKGMYLRLLAEFQRVDASLRAYREMLAVLDAFPKREGTKDA